MWEANWPSNKSKFTILNVHLESNTVRTIEIIITKMYNYLKCSWFFNLLVIIFIGYYDVKIILYFIKCFK